MDPGLTVHSKAVTGLRNTNFGYVYSTTEAPPVAALAWVASATCRNDFLNLSKPKKLKKPETSISGFSETP